MNASSLASIACWRAYCASCARSDERALALVEVVVARVGDQVAAVDLDDLADHAVQELAVVRGHHERALERAQPLLEPQDRLEIEVVGRLVEQQRVGLHDQDPREAHAHLPAARERADVAVDLLRREAEPASTVRARASSP
jgi:hypothetical protein